jgi:DNA-binding IclR family transcriptional regulator
MTEDGDTDDRQGIKSVETAMRVLMALEQSAGPMSLSAIARASDTQPSKAHRYLVSLCRVGLASQATDSGLYDLGPTMRRLGAEALRRTNEVAVVSGHAPQLRDRTGHSVNVAVWGDHGPLVVNWAYGSHALPIVVRIGSTLPLLGSSIGRVFLAHLPPVMTDGLLARALARPESGWSQAKVDELRHQVTADGYAVSSGGVIPGIASVAAPVFAATDPLPLAMSVVIPDELASPQEVESVGEELVETAKRISAELGWAA